jgi:peroxiredoxin Q/BCP
VARDVEVVVVGPEDAAAFARYWEKESLPFIGLPDPKHGVLKLYGQQVKLFKLGRMPAQVLIDKAGVARFVHYGHDMQDIPENAEILALLDRMEGTLEDLSKDAETLPPADRMDGTMVADV